MAETKTTEERLRGARPIGRTMKVNVQYWVRDQLDALAAWRTEQSLGTERVRISEVTREVLQLGLVTMQQQLEQAEIEVPGFDPKDSVLRHGS